MMLGRHSGLRSADTPQIARNENGPRTALELLMCQTAAAVPHEKGDVAFE